jgi:hypothetical protein
MGWAHTLMQNLRLVTRNPKYKATDSRKLGAQYIFNAKLDKV